jgi:hypothetical protein
MDCRLQVGSPAAPNFGAPGNYGPCAMAQFALPLARACKAPRPAEVERTGGIAGKEDGTLDGFCAFFCRLLLSHVELVLQHNSLM